MFQRAMLPPSAGSDELRYEVGIDIGSECKREDSVGPSRKREG
jgi:hypothetical protein